MALFLIVLRWLELRFLIIHNAFAIYAGGLAFLFTGLGIWLALKLTKPKTLIVEKAVLVDSAHFLANEEALKETGISQRELEVLQLMAAGKSNQEIADQLFVSLNTVKTHLKNLFEKLDVGRRTQAVDKARKLGIVA
ncbi:response regulator transcription factor [uncultured Imperialibacter sp.]|uniref:helix-turn-helix transcriptional regulator n=1 Tax=uncultured Imperialibacter sp. TaxID=1672639 RepID=UPI0030D8D56B|tara:strand:+ start:3871 stop:4281 length:411 start_codon:yes stop_codon:yes gene_type:complete